MDPNSDPDYIDPDSPEGQEIQAIFDELHYVAKHRREQIIGKADLMLSEFKTGKAKLILNDKGKTLTDAPPEVPYVKTTKTYTVSTEHEINVLSTIGQYYKDIAWDPTLSEAFDTGFLIAIQLIQQGYFEVPEKEGE